VVAAAVQPVLQGLEASRERVVRALAEVEAGGKAKGQGGEEGAAEQGLLHFMQVYVEGAVGILRTALNSLEAA
jgi:hypothetical protein